MGECKARASSWGPSAAAGRNVGGTGAQVVAGHGKAGGGGHSWRQLGPLHSERSSTRPPARPSAVFQLGCRPHHDLLQCSKRV